MSCGNPLHPLLAVAEGRSLMLTLLGRHPEIHRRDLYIRIRLIFSLGVWVIHSIFAALTKFSPVRWMSG